MKNVLLCIILTALFFGGWPIVARTAGKTGTTGAFIMAAMALVPIGIVMMRQGVLLPMSTSWPKLCIAGMMMGSGLIAYNFAVSNPKVEVSIVVPTISTLMIIVTTLGGMFFFGEPLTVRKVIGITLLIAGIAFLRPTAPSPSKNVPVIESDGS